MFSSEWISQKIVNLKDSVFSPFLCLGLVENVSNVLLQSPAPYR